LDRDAMHWLTTAETDVGIVIQATWAMLTTPKPRIGPRSSFGEGQDLAKGILEAIDMDSYRVEKKAAMKMALATRTPRSNRRRQMLTATSASPRWIA
jgi:hypothetical protein